MPYVVFSDLFGKGHVNDIVRPTVLTSEQKDHPLLSKGVSFDSVVEPARVDAEMTKKYLDLLFEDGDLVTYGLFTYPGGKFIWNQGYKQDLMNITNEDLKLLMGLDGDHTLLNSLYILVNPSKDIVEEGKRGGKDNVKRVRTLYADIDVKHGAFKTQEDAKEFIGSIPVKPSMVVSTGSGGYHAYWFIEGGLDPVEGDLQRLWAEWLQTYTDVHLDGLKNIDRQLRLPGTLRLDKLEGPWKAINLVESEGYLYSPDYLKGVVATIRRDDAVKVKRARQEVSGIQRNMNLNYKELTKDSSAFGQVLLSATIEDRINEIPWERILGSLGWTYISTDSDERDIWQRPNFDGKAAKRSATVNWPKSPHVMSLQSDAEETGLADLKAKKVPLTKMVVLWRLHYQEDDKKMIQDVLSGKFD